MTQQPNKSLVFSATIVFLSVLSCMEKIESASALQSVDRVKTLKVVNPSLGWFYETVGVVGLATPKNVSTVHFLTEGKVEGCRVEPGRNVASGEELCRIDATLVNLEMDRAEAAVKSASRAVDPEFLQRQKNLFESGVIGQIDYEKIRIEAEKAASLLSEASSILAMLQKKRELHVLRAPFSGKVLEVRTQKGMPISPALPAVVLSSTGALVIKAEVPARFFNDVVIGKRFLVSSIAGESLTGGAQEPAREREEATSPVVIGKSENIVPEKQVFTVEVAGFSRELSEKLVAGMLVSAELVLHGYPKATTIPFAALTEWESKTKAGSVFVVDENSTIRARAVKTTAPRGELVHIKEGLSTGEFVVFPVPAFVVEGDKVIAVLSQEGK